MLQVSRYQDGHFPEVLILITNFPGLDKLTSDQSIITYGRRTGITLDADGVKRELYEYFDLDAYRNKIRDQDESEARAKAESRREAIQATAEQAKIHALKVNQDAAAKGDMFGLLRMGERYRDGDGVEKNLGKAREYLQKAADAGSPTAKEELSKLEAK
jgi:TPR repeat protein